MRSEHLKLSDEEKSPRGVAAVFGGLLFGFGVWALHLLLIYGITAVTCAHLPAFRDQPLAVKAVLGGLTVAALILVALHGLKHYRRANEADEDEDFVSWLNAALDGAAAVAILWQAFPILTVPLCL